MMAISLATSATTELTAMRTLRVVNGYLKLGLLEVIQLLSTAKPVQHTLTLTIHSLTPMLIRIRLNALLVKINQILVRFLDPTNTTSKDLVSKVTEIPTSLTCGRLRFTLHRLAVVLAAHEAAQAAVSLVAVAHEAPVAAVAVAHKVAVALQAREAPQVRLAHEAHQAQARVPVAVALPVAKAHQVVVRLAHKALQAQARVLVAAAHQAAEVRQAQALL